MASGDSSEHGPTTSVLSCIGDTPLIELSAVSAEAAGDVTIYGKMEFVNPTGSIKDRIYREMIRSAEQRGELTDDMEILECSTGNAGIACAFVGTQRGYDVTVVMPEGMSEERKKLIRAYGGTLVETPGGESDVDLALEHVEETLAENPEKYWFPDQFSNEDNPKAHELTTGVEIREQLGGVPDAFVAGQGTGGTITGVGRELRSVDGGVQLYAVEPAEAPLLTRREWGRHSIEGIGDGFVPENLDVSLLDGVVPIEGEEAITRARSVAVSEGLFCGISSGANVEAARRVADDRDVDTVVTVICDSGQRYFSTELFEEVREIDVPEREHPLDERSRELLDEYQSDWHVID